MATKKKKSGKIISVDFTGVEVKQITPEGDYAVKVKEITEETGDKGQYLAWVLEVSTGEFKGQKLYYNTSLTKQSLWNLRAVLEALGVEVSKGKMQLDIKSYYGMEMGVSVETEKYRGKLKNVVVDIYNLEDADDGDDDGKEEDLEEMSLEELIEYAEEEEIELTAKQKKSKAKALAAIQEAEAEEPEAEAESEEQDLEDMSLEELVEYAEEEEIELTRKQRKSKSKALAAIQEAEEAEPETEPEEEPEEEEEPQPKKRKRAKK